MAQSHEIVLLGKKYKLKSEHDDAYLAELANFVTSQVAEVQRHGGAISTLDAALLAALNIADDMHRVKREAEERLAAIGEKTQQLMAALDEHLDPKAVAAAVEDPSDSSDAEPGDEPPRKAETSAR